MKKLLADLMLKTKALEIALKKHLSPGRQRREACKVQAGRAEVTTRMKGADAGFMSEMASCPVACW